MITRRDALASTPFLLLLQAAQAQTSTQSGNTPVFQQDLPNISMDDWQVMVSEIHQAPGQVGRPHRHPGFVLVYVLEGTLISKISGGPEKTYTAGQMFYEPPGSTHEVSRNPSGVQTVRFLAFIFAKKGAQLTTPV